MRSFLNIEPEAFGLSLPLSSDLRTLDRLLGKVLAGQEGEGLINLARKLVGDPNPDPERLLEDKAFADISAVKGSPDLLRSVSSRPWNVPLSLISLA